MHGAEEFQEREFAREDGEGGRDVGCEGDEGGRGGWGNVGGDVGDGVVNG